MDGRPVRLSRDELHIRSSPESYFARALRRCRVATSQCTAQRVPRSAAYSPASPGALLGHYQPMPGPRPYAQRWPNAVSTHPACRGRGTSRSPARSGRSPSAVRGQSRKGFAGDGAWQAPPMRKVRWRRAVPSLAPYQWRSDPTWESSRARLDWSPGAAVMCLTASGIGLTWATLDAD